MAKILIGIILISLASSVGAFVDPTRPLIRAPKPAPIETVKVEQKQPLTAIFTKGKNRFAVIEDKIYRTGDTYRNSQIIRITNDKVILRTAEGTRRLTLIQKIKK
ncbi:hypothetical protein FLL45_17645 [Aliikangiella marina]|uniref:MSHA biogenesis protein MshK n=1 Tax=Aliikangiella marina TaxID=1712262 RepID=A0A545T491_9GAMM|nr:hypothetical protein [Aliikangiella marina]TQV71994.1 hypothetical protein FLL45_17365 [Aliikangiella marina]TQV72047.1 hypothetical protein FLL45_17645 [Aliikangiella marina]